MIVAANLEILWYSYLFSAFFISNRKDRELQIDSLEITFKTVNPILYLDTECTTSLREKHAHAFGTGKAHDPGVSNLQSPNKQKT